MKRLFVVLIIAAVSAPAFMPVVSKGQPGSADDPQVPCPAECESSRTGCELSCSQIVGGGAAADRRRRCVKSCGEEEGECNVRCLNPTPKPTPKPNPYRNKTCADVCLYNNARCEETCSQLVGGGARSARRNACIRGCGDELSQCEDRCVNPTPRPALNPELQKSSPCAPQCDSVRAQCEATCTMYQEGEKREACASGCGAARDNCLTNCPPGGD